MKIKTTPKSEMEKITMKGQNSEIRNKRSFHKWKPN